MQGPGPTAEPRQTNKRWGKGHSPARELLVVSGDSPGSGKGARDAVGIGSPIAPGTDLPSSPVPPLSFSVGDGTSCRGCSLGSPGVGTGGRGERGSAPGQVRGRGRAVRAGVAVPPGRAIRRRSTTGGQPHLNKTARPNPSAARTGLSPHRMRCSSAAGEDFSRVRALLVRRGERGNP